MNGVSPDGILEFIIHIQENIYSSKIKYSRYIFRFLFWLCVKIMRTSNKEIKIISGALAFEKN